MAKDLCKYSTCSLSGMSGNKAVSCQVQGTVVMPAEVIDDSVLERDDCQIV